MFRSIGVLLIAALAVLGESLRRVNAPSRTSPGWSDEGAPMSRGSWTRMQPIEGTGLLGEPVPAESLVRNSTGSPNRSDLTWRGRSLRAHR